MVNTLMPSALPTALGPLDPDDGDAGRQQRGMAIAAMVPMPKTPLGFRVKSQSGNGSYIVNMDGDSPYCSCPDFENGRFRRPCKHIWGVWMMMQRENGDSGDSHRNGMNDTNGASPPQSGLVVPSTSADGLVLPPSGLVVPGGPAPAPPVSPSASGSTDEEGRNWHDYDDGQEAEGDEFYRLLRALVNTIVPEFPRGPHRPPKPLDDILFCAALKVYTRNPCRRGKWTWRYAYEKGLLSCVPSRQTVMRYMADPGLFPWIYLAVVESAKPLSSMDTIFAPDSSGFSSRVFDRWFVHKWGRTVAETRWIKLHLMAGCRTHIVVAAEATDKPTADAPYLPRFVQIAAANFDRVEAVVADKGYLSHANYHAIHNIGAEGFIPFKKNSTPGPGHHKADPLWEKRFYEYYSKPEEFDRVYHKRSNVETVFEQIKDRCDSSVSARLPEAQVNEVMLKVLCHNICMLNKAAYELGCTRLFDPQPFR